MLGSLLPALLMGWSDRRRYARQAVPTLKVRINGRRYRTKDWSLTGFRLDDFDGVCAPGEQVRGVLLFKGRRGEVLAEAVRVGPGEAVGFRILEISSHLFLQMSAHPTAVDPVANVK
jgi:hypothetical protein